jgi:hypothetical protein
LSTFSEDSFNNVIDNIIEIFSIKNYNIYLKGHPRLNLPNIKNKSLCFIINHYIPSELISADNVCLFIGIESYSLCYFANLKNTNYDCISILNLIEIKNEERSDFFKNYLLLNSNNKIKFIDTFKYFEKF